MASLKFRLGSRLERPTSFQSDRTIADAKFIYRLDTQNLVCHRQAKHRSDDKSGGYFRLILEQKPKTMHSIKSTIVVPTLVVILIVGLLLVIYPLLPAVKYQVQKRVSSFSNETSALAPPDPGQNKLIIPKIGVSTAILEGPSLKILNKHEGVWHQTGTMAANFVVAGHRFKYLPPNTTTFYNLDKLQVGDTVVIDWYGQRHLYIIKQTKRIDQNDTSILVPTAQSQVTLYTCYDKQQTQRIVVIANPAP